MRLEDIPGFAEARDGGAGDLLNDAFDRWVGATPRRPASVKRMRVAHVAANRGSQFRTRIVPWDVACPGDVQVAIPMPVGSTTTRVSFGALGWAESRVPVPMEARTFPVSLDVLGDHLASVESIVVSTRVFATRPLPNVRELILLRGGVATETWKHLSRLETLVYSGPPAEVDLGHLPATLETLLFVGGYSSHGDGWLEPIARLTRLKRLRIEAPYRASVAPIGALTGLRHLELHGGTHVGKLAPLTALETVKLHGISLPDLRRFREWKRLRRLSIHHVRELKGIEELTSLRELRLGGRRPPDDLTPLSALPNLTSLEINTCAVDRDFGDLRGAKRLRRLILNIGSVMGRLGVVRDLEFVRDMSELEELRIDWATVAGGALDMLRGKNLTKVHLRGAFGAEAERVRKELPGPHVDIVAVEPPRPARGASADAERDAPGGRGRSRKPTLTRIR